MAHALKMALATLIIGTVLIGAPVLATAACTPIIVGNKLCQLCCAGDGTSCVVMACG